MGAMGRVRKTLKVHFQFRTAMKRRENVNRPKNRRGAA